MKTSLLAIPVLLFVFSQGMVAQTVDWEAMIPVIPAALRKAFPERRDSTAPRIVETADLTGNGVPEALVSSGSGAYADLYVLMRMEGRKPEVALFKLPSGQVAPLEFARGSSVMNGANAELRPKEHAIYSMEYSMDVLGKRIKRCTVVAYRWNADAGIFEYHRRLSQGAAKDSCRTAGR